MSSDALNSTLGKTTRTKLSAWGTSQAVRIPKEICEEAGLAVGDEVDMITYHDANGVSIVIRGTQGAHRNFKAAPIVTIKDLFQDYVGDYHGEELDWGNDVGAEVLEW
jgi:antitoxin MazE